MLTTTCLIKALEMAAPPLKSRLTTPRLLTPTSPLRLPKPGWGDFGDEIVEHKKSPCHSPSDWFFACFLETWSLGTQGIQGQDTSGRLFYKGHKSAAMSFHIVAEAEPGENSHQLWVGFLSEGTTRLQRSRARRHAAWKATRPHRNTRTDSNWEFDLGKNGI